MSTTPVSDDFTLIDLGHGYFAIVDADSPALLHHWTATLVRRKERTYVYAKRSIKKGKGEYRNQYMHRFLLNAPEDMHVDHINRVTLDCRMSNLRLATRSQNATNRVGSRPSRSGFIGVDTMKNGRFRARLRVNGKIVHVGVYKTPEEAARAFDTKAKEVRGAFAMLNFPEGKE